MLVEKNFDLLSILEDSCQQMEDDTLRIEGRKAGYKDVISFIQEKELRITQLVEEEDESETDEQITFPEDVSEPVED